MLSRLARAQRDLAVERDAKHRLARVAARISAQCDTDRAERDECRAALAAVTEERDQLARRCADAEAMAAFVVRVQPLLEGDPA